MDGITTSCELEYGVERVQAVFMMVVFDGPQSEQWFSYSIQLSHGTRAALWLHQGFWPFNTYSVLISGRDEAKKVIKHDQSWCSLSH